jgi:hypothetical protein
MPIDPDLERTGDSEGTASLKWTWTSCSTALHRISLARSSLLRGCDRVPRTTYAAASAVTLTP